MRVGIDATVMAQSRTTGIGRLIHSLVSAMAETDADHEFTLLYRPRSLKHARKIWKPRDPRFRIRFLGSPVDRWTLGRLDVFHSTYQRMPPSQGTTPYLGTLHDIYFASPAYAGDVATSRRWAARYRDVVRRSRLIMTLSEYSKREIVELLGAAPERVRVIVPAAAPAFRIRSANEIAAAQSRYGLQQPYILFAGGTDPRKNLSGALRAFALATQTLPPEICLAVVGAGQAGDATRAALSTSLLSRVRFLGFVPDDDFAALMSGCRVFLFPTLFEGFGLPALEAMSCGAAVVTSSTTSLPEVCGDAAVLVDPSDAPALAAALIRVETDAVLRERLQRRGPERATRFSWRSAADHTLDLYREVASHPTSF